MIRHRSTPFGCGVLKAIQAKAELWAGPGQKSMLKKAAGELLADPPLGRGTGAVEPHPLLCGPGPHAHWEN